MYRCAATSIEGFVQQLAVGYVATGHYFYVTGRIPAGKNADATDRKLIHRYQVNISKWARARRKRGGYANVHYLRFQHFFVIIATHGEHRFFADEPQVRDIREDPLRFCGYSIGCGKGSDGKWHASVRIHAKEYKDLKAYFLDIATHRSVENLAEEFGRVRYAPFARVRRQMLNILRAVNRKRKEASFELVPVSALRLRRRPVRPFQELAACIAA
jgi:hypothetical protein